ncbi:hypothetical protein DUZ99_04360 [Xylanibacillus composti]|uniref:Mannosyl-glycoprotein endo-beta-N-acetylglucosaminidase n=1 Tax=Xylanibacillus composti TaxID=1572762 RepID=A0A8J4H2K4_9BACL|nr:glucosaminidase domain-containing protein [Xylanibacillus composti]MDT9724221.1 hypothetical protein [Xylanibacillus composti]GIQ68262.1 hypothetical protein XYCOK13_10860 [Xylanibacillus composti]
MNAPNGKDATTANAVWEREWIGPAAIGGLKQLLTHKLGDRDVRERAAVFADALHRMVQSRLPALAESQRVAVRIRLVKLLCTEKGALTDRDVLEECLRLQLLREEDFAVLSEWVQARTGTRAGTDELRHWAELVRSNKPLPIAMTDAAVAASAMRSDTREAHRQGLGTRSGVASVPALSQHISGVDGEVPAEARQTAKAHLSLAGPQVQPSYAADSLAAASAEALPPGTWTAPSWFRPAAAAGLLLALLGFGIGVLLSHAQHLAEGQTQSAQPVLVFQPSAPASPHMENGLPRPLQHRYVNREQLQLWLARKNSKLAEDPYYTTMLNTAKEYNLHPYLLFAVAGQENGYVQTDNPNAEKIANNPFNVYHSWWEYNTDITDSSRIAAKTIVRLSWDQPEDIHPFQWINREYAEDQNWWKGVKAIFEQMERDIPLAPPSDKGG